MRAVGSGFSFEVVNADDYDALRPGYAPAAVAWVVEARNLGEGSTVVDLAAGTGQLSRRLALHDVEVIAVEPARNMREAIAERLPAVRVVDATAEYLPLGDGVADAVVVGNAFHHFDARAAFAEIGRVLRPGGALALFWAWPLEDGREYDRYPGLREIDDVVERMRATSGIATAYRRWAQPPPPVDGFTGPERREFPTTHLLASARLADLYATSSDVASLPPSTRIELLGRIHELARQLPKTLELPGRSVVDLFLREGAA
jgi:SAM-dependent methyltransferase